MSFLSRSLLFVLLLPALFGSNPQSDFLKAQKQYKRVKAAFEEKEALLRKKLQSHEMAFDNFNLLLVAYKSEDLIEVYAQAKKSKVYKKIISYQVCTRSGKLGPKRKEGDLQVPEGFYYIDRFNPSSSFHLSLGINYPNLSDKRKSTAKHLGGDIFIHGACASIGCLPITNDCIKELYVLAVWAKHYGQNKIPVYIFPFKMTKQALEAQKSQYHKETVAFWDNLKEGYDRFLQQPRELSFSINAQGDYVF